MSLTVIRRTEVFAVNAKRRVDVAISARFIASFYALGDSVDEKSELDRFLKYGMNRQIGTDTRAEKNCSRYLIRKAVERGNQSRVEQDRYVLPLAEARCGCLSVQRDVD